MLYFKFWKYYCFVLYFEQIIAFIKKILPSLNVWTILCANESLSLLLYLLYCFLLRNGTSMISLIIPPKDQISRVAKMLADEFGTASNIKSRVNRLSVLGAITSVQQRLKLYNKGKWVGLASSMIFHSHLTSQIIDFFVFDKFIFSELVPFKHLNCQLIYICCVCVGTIGRCTWFNLFFYRPLHGIRHRSSQCACRGQNVHSIPLC